MSDPRNVAHDKKVKHDKDHQKPDAAENPELKRKTSQNAFAEATPTPAEATKSEHELEKSMVVLSKLKEIDFHSRTNLETLAELMLTVEDELKQKDFSESVEAVYSAQDNFHTKIAALIKSYESMCESLTPTA